MAGGVAGAAALAAMPKEEQLARPRALYDGFVKPYHERHRNDGEQSREHVEDSSAVADVAVELGHRGDCRAGRRHASEVYDKQDVFAVRDHSRSAAYFEDEQQNSRHDDEAQRRGQVRSSVAEDSARRHVRDDHSREQHPERPDHGAGHSQRSADNFRQPQAEQEHGAAYEYRYDIEVEQYLLPSYPCAAAQHAAAVRPEQNDLNDDECA